MSSYAEIVNADRRLVILRALAQDAGYEHNESVLQSVLNHFAHKVTRDQVRTQLAWLAEQELVTLREVSGYQIATLTARGADAAEGSAIVPGVKRPSPRS